MKPEKGQNFYDEDFFQISEGDLLRVFHFRKGRKRVYMYKIVITIDGYTYGKDIRSDHKYGLWSVSDDDGRIKGTKVIDKADWTKEEEFKRAAKKRERAYLPF